MSAREFVVRGLLAGLLAGFAAFGAAVVFGESAVSAAIALEDATGHHSGADAVVPRWLQASAGLLTGTVAAGAALGGLVGVLVALAWGRLGRLGARATTLSVTAMAFVAIDLVPFVAYPPNPPGVGREETIDQRTALYFVLMAISVIAAVAAVLLGRRAARRWGSWYAALAAVSGYLVVMAAVIGLMPSYDEVPFSFPANLLYEFRLASFGTRLTLWLVLGVVLAELTYRLSRRGAPADTTLATTAV